MDELDDIFSSFSSNLSKASANKDFLGQCDQCRESILVKDGCLKAMGKMFHINHLFCTSCNKSIPQNTPFLVYPADSKPYHNDCYEKQFYEKCSQCTLSVNEDIILHATGPDGRRVPFHKDCFKCGVVYSQEDQKFGSGASVVSGCGKPLIDTNSASTLLTSPTSATSENSVIGEYQALSDKSEYLVQAGIVYCNACFESHFLHACSGCHKRIKDIYETRGEKDGKNQKRIRYLVNQGQPYCVDCYESRFLPSCSKCKQRIRRSEPADDGLYLTVGDSHYHPDCYRCSECKCEFDDLKAYVWQDGELYCQQHYQQKVIAQGVSGPA